MRRLPARSHALWRAAESRSMASRFPMMVGLLRYASQTANARAARFRIFVVFLIGPAWSPAPRPGPAPGARRRRSSPRLCHRPRDPRIRPRPVHLPRRRGPEAVLPAVRLVRPPGKPRSRIGAASPASAPRVLVLVGPDRLHPPAPAADKARVHVQVEPHRQRQQAPQPVQGLCSGMS